MACSPAAAAAASGQGHRHQDPGQQRPRPGHEQQHGRLADSTRIETAGADARGIWSYGTAASVNNTLSLGNGSRIDTQNAVGLLVSGGSHRITLDRSDITARRDGSADDGVLLYARTVDVTSGGTTTTIETGQIRFDASASGPTGDVLIESGALDMDLTNGSALTGAVWQRGNGRVNSPRWTAAAPERARRLHAGHAEERRQRGLHAATIRRVQDPDGQELRRRRHAVDQHPARRRQLAHRPARDRRRRGHRQYRIARRQRRRRRRPDHAGIRVVETINGGVTASDAFHLDAGSTGYRASIGTLALNGYDYSLVRGGNGGVADDWYLTSEYDGSAPPGPIDPPDGSDGSDWPHRPDRPDHAHRSNRTTGSGRSVRLQERVARDRRLRRQPARRHEPVLARPARPRRRPDANADAGHGNRLWTRAWPVTTAACAWPRARSRSAPTAPCSRSAATYCAPAWAAPARCKPA